jgi:membrane associated rhomboid family serine protease
MHPFLQDLKNQYKNGSILIKLIFINVAVFLIVNVVGSLLHLFNITYGVDLFISWLALPSDLSELVFKPWTIVAYMFLIEGLWHLFTNMMWLYFGSQIFNQFLNEKKLLSVYLLGGLVGGLLFVLAYNVFPVFTSSIGIPVLGASASVMAVLIAAVAYVPNFMVKLPFIGDVKLKYIGLVSIIMFVVVGFDQNTGGKIAHLGGAIFGFFFIQQLKKGKDFTIRFSRWMDYLMAMFKPKKNMKVVYKKQGKTKSNKDYNSQKVNNQKRVDSILDKISKSGYDSLSADEKAILFDASKK